MKILNCILSYNRGSYLRNCIKSIDEIFRYGDIVIFDDNSDDQDTLEILQQLEKSIPVFKPSASIDFGKSKHGHMYYNMDAAIEYAIEQEYEYIQFIQDDCQYVWHDEFFEQKIVNIYKTHPNVSMVENLFFNIGGKPNLPKQTEVFSETFSVNRNKRGYLDVGIWKLDILKNIRFSFGNGSEQSNSLWWRKEGYISHRLLTPSQCHVPEPTVFRHQKITRLSSIENDKDFLMKPLSAAQIKTLHDNALVEFPFAENYCMPWGWECESPYILTSEQVEKKDRQRLTKKHKFMINGCLFFIRGKVKKYILFLLSFDTYIK